MATYYFTGDCKWAKVYKPDDRYKKYSIDVELDEVQQKEYDSIELKGKAREGYVSFSSYPDKKKGNMPSPPTVMDADGKPFTDLIGNGSNVTVKIETYTYNNEWGKGNGHRLMAVKVNKHVKFEGEGKSNLVTQGNTAASASEPPSRPKILF